MNRRCLLPFAASPPLACYEILRLAKSEITFELSRTGLFRPLNEADKCIAKQVESGWMSKSLSAARTCRMAK
jgi:hypothetical protein